MSIYIQREREKNERSTQFKLQWHREAGRGVGAEGVGWGLQKGGGIHLSVMDKRAGERGQFQSTVNGIVVEGGGDGGVFPTVRPPSGGLLLHTNHQMIFYAVPVCIYAVHHYVPTVYLQSCY